MSGVLQKDDNGYPVMGGVSSSDADVVLNCEIDPITGRLLTDSAGGSGTVTSVSVVSANGFAGSVATATTTPAITISTTINAPVLAGNGTAISAATTTGSGSTVVLATSPTLVTPVIGIATGTSLAVSGTLTTGAAAGTTGALLLKGTTSGTVTLSVADAAGTWTMKLPTTDGDASQFLQTDGSGNTTWATPSGTGDVVGPASATDNAIVRFDGTTGKLIQNSTVTISDAGGIATTIANTGNAIGLSVTQNDTTNNPNAVTITNAGSGDGIGITQNGTGYAIDITGTSTTGTLFNVYTNAIRSSGVLFNFVDDNASTVSSVMNIQSDGSGTAFTITSAGAPFQGVRNNDSSSVRVMTLEGDRATPAANDEAYLQMRLSDSAGNQDEFARITWQGTTVTSTSEVGRLKFSVTTAGALAEELFLTGTALSPAADGGLDLGTTTLGYQNVHLNTGATINIENGNWVATHTSGILTVGTGDLRVTTAGTNTASVVTVGGTQTLTSKTLTSPTITTATLSGTQVLAENASIALDPAGSADGKYTGITIAGTAGAALAFGDLVYLAAADSRWELADADAATTADRMMGMCVLAAAADADPTVLLLVGQIRADAKFPALTIGSAVYVGETAGAIQVAIPTGADNVIRRVGYALTADEIYFNPSMDSQITVA